MVLVLAEKTGWTEQFLVWDLPLVRALEYYHAALWGNGVWTVRHERTAAQQLAMLTEYVDDSEDDE